jgi:hypothetical protein
MDAKTLTTTLIVVAAIGFLVVLGLLAWAMSRYQRTKRLEKQFGPEYERAVQEAGDKKEAEKALDARLQHVRSLDIRSLSESERDHFAHAWRSTQAKFIDEPAAALREADQLIKEVMLARGYPVQNFEERAADISVDYPNLVQHYRSLRQIADRSPREDISTEDMRQAMVDCRALFEELLGTTIDEYAHEKEKM